VRFPFGGDVVREVCAWAVAHPDAAKDFSASLAVAELGPLAALADLLGKHPAAAKDFLRDCAQSHQLLLVSLFTRPRQRGHR